MEEREMTLVEKYWMTIWFVFLRYLSILLILSGIGWILAGYYASPWWYLGLFSWPLFIMLAVVNLKYICVLTKVNGLEFSKLYSKKAYY